MNWAYGRFYRSSVSKTGLCLTFETKFLLWYSSSLLELTLRRTVQRAASRLPHTNDPRKPPRKSINSGHNLTEKAVIAPMKAADYPCVHRVRRGSKPAVLVKSTQADRSEMKPTETHEQQTEPASETQPATTEYTSDAETATQAPDEAEIEGLETNDGEDAEPEADNAVVPQHAKPLLTVKEQIAHLKAKGVTFDLCTADEAAAYLSGKCQFFKVAAYRKLFSNHENGERMGCYIGLDFAHLKLLAGIDRRLRDTLLHMTLDAEHFASANLLTEAEAHGEDGYAIMADYMESVSPSRRRYIENELDIRSNDIYCGAVIRKYRNDMPIWAFCEVVSFGTFIGLMKFCAERWNDRRILANHYLLKKTKSVRNACAHSQCVLNDLSEQAVKGERVAPAVTQAIAECGVPKRLRSKKLRSPRMAQIATLLYQYAALVPEGNTRTERKAQLAAFFRYFDNNAGILPAENPAVSSVDFMRRLTEGFNLLD